jgi:DNA-binding NtrC family response regulator
MGNEAKQRGRILIIDDDLDMLQLLQALLEKEGFRVETGATVSTLHAKIKQYSFDCVLLDLFLGDDTSVSVLPFLIREAPFTKVIVMTGFGSIELAVEAMQLGASSFVSKGHDPYKIVEELKKRMLSGTTMGADQRQVFQNLGLVGQSPAMQTLYDDLLQIKDSEATVLLLGESGTGKELVARAIHTLSARQSSLFAALNCAAIPETLLESELFGHKKGAFTDAKTDRKGIFETCSEGTLFLDEIGDMPFSLQAKLLRVLQEKEVVPVGSTRPVQVRTRVIAATHRDLEEEASLGKFREDLFFRINVLTIYLPPLRERKGDIALLASTFIDLFAKRYQKSIQPLSQSMAARLEAHDWPGNVRELQNSIERAVILAKDGELQIEDVLRQKANRRHSRLKSEPQAETDMVSYAKAKEDFERSYLLKVLATAKGSIAEAARLSGRYRSDIYRLLERYDIKPDEFK